MTAPLPFVGPRLLVFCGPAGSGKDALASFALGLTRDRTARFAFADRPRALCTEVLGLTYEALFTREGKAAPSKFRWRDLAYLETAIPERYEPDRVLLNREVLQKWCEFFRKMNPRCWADRLHVFASFHGGRRLCCVTDLRFREELDAVRRYESKVVRLSRRPGDEPWRGHVSERAWLDFDVDLELDNQNQDEGETRKLLAAALRSWGWLP